MSTTHTFSLDDSYNFTKEQKDWLRAAHRTVIRLLKRNPTFHAPDFWAANTKGDFPAGGRNYQGNRALGRVIRQIIKADLMTDSNPGWGKRVAKTGTFKPVYTSNLYGQKVSA